ncbi:MAG TPA: hypothetical protein VIL17_04020 [Coriobacteriia bacterium]
MRHVGATLAVLGLLALLVGCSTTNQSTARFVGYKVLQDGTRVAVVGSVKAVASPIQQEAYVGIDDLKPGDLVIVKQVGRDWDQPQWKPEAEVVSRASKP